MNVAPVVYSKADVSREDNEIIYNKYLHLVQWRADGQDTILDIGPGPGDMAVKVLIPKIPNGFKRLIGADIAQDMVDYANKVYSSSKIHFEQWDMVGDPKILLNKYPDGFNHIFSVFALHYDPDQERIIRNIYDLLSPDGDCLLSILGRHDIYDVYLELSKNPKWNQLTSNKYQISMPMQYKNDRKEIYEELFRAAGFKSCTIQVLHRTKVFENIGEIKDYINAINPFLGKLTSTQRDEYFEDYVKAIIKLGLGEETENGINCKFFDKYEFLIINARK